MDSISYPQRPRRIAIFGNSWQNEHLDSLRRFFEDISAQGVEVNVEARFADYLRSVGISLPSVNEVTAFPVGMDLVVSIGGDGTFLRTADWMGKSSVPVMGINTGHLGYLAGFSFERPTEVFKAIQGEFESTPRMLLKVESEGMPPGFRPYALNEISVAKGDTTSMVSIRAEIDGRYLTCYLADGLIISTPTGSTAYNLSCGGPILQPTMQSVVLTPIAPHSLTLRPLVIGADAVLTLEVRSRGEKVHVGVDGRTFSLPSDGTEIRVRRAPYCLKVAQPLSSDFSSILRSKLGWGS